MMTSLSERSNLAHRACGRHQLNYKLLVSSRPCPIILLVVLYEPRTPLPIFGTSMTGSNNEQTLTLWRPVGPKELALIEASGMRAFPPRLPEQPIFYPVLTEDYAVKIARDWNVPASGAGHVLRFAILRGFIDTYEVREAGGRKHREYWIPSEDLADFNAAIVGPIVLVRSFPLNYQLLHACVDRTFRGSPDRNEVPSPLLLLFGSSCVQAHGFDADAHAMLGRAQAVSGHEVPPQKRPRICRGFLKQNGTQRSDRSNGRRANSSTAAI